MNKRLLTILILVAYIAILVKILVFKDMPFIRSGNVRLNFGGIHEGPPNLIPFKTIVPYLLGEKGFFIAFLNIVGNIVLLMPIGFLIPFSFRSMTWKKTLLLAIASGLALEGTQALLHVGIFDIDDVILNGLGVVLGYLAFMIFTKKSFSMNSKRIIIVAVLVIAAIGASFTVAFYQKPQQPNVVVDQVESNQPVSIDTVENKIAEGLDPCKGTGGTGQIVSVGKNKFTIKLNNGKDQTINLSHQAVIKNSKGSISTTDLKKGDRVTVVVMPEKDGVEIARTVLVCSTSGPKSGK